MSQADEREVNSEDEGEDLMEGMERDYAPIKELDTYDDENIDQVGLPSAPPPTCPPGADSCFAQDDYSPMSPSARASAEDLMRKRDRDERPSYGARVPRALRGFDDDDERPLSRRRRERDDAVDLGSADVQINIEDLPEGVSLREFIETDMVRREVKRRFIQFLRTHTDENGRAVYKDKIKKMCDANKQSLEVSYMHLSQAQPVFGIWVADAPGAILEVLDDAAMDVVSQQYPNYQDIHPDIFVRIIDLPIVDKLRDIRQVHLNALLKVSGVVTRRTNVFPQLKLVKYDCGKCGYTLGPFAQKNQGEEAKPKNCPECQSGGPFSINQEETVYRNYQKMTIQETPGTVPAGRLPRYKDVILLGDLIDCARPGEQVEVTGIYTNNLDTSLNTKNGFPVFATVIEANHVSKKEDLYSPFRLTDDDVEKIKELSKDPKILDKVIDSIAPSIFGHKEIKTGIALSMFGGQPKDVGGKHRIRGDINVLLLGDPGTAKSQFLKYVEKSTPRAVFTTGKGASAVGLTAAVHMDPMTREWTLEGGALVLADTGVCLIDEFDKMSDQDRTSIHEAMEQQSISISKAGIVCTLQARCAVMAAANPKGGRYNPSLHLHENVDLTEPILSRFDVLRVVKDTVDPINDARLAKHVVKSHANSHPDRDMADDDESEGNGEGPIVQSLLKKYVVYAKQNCKPRLAAIDTDKLTKVYAELRRESEAGGGMPLAVRHIESIIRMSEACARMQLRQTVRDEDLDFGIRVMLESFISSQKFGVQRSLEKQFSKYLTCRKDNDELLFHLLQSLFRDEMQFARSKNFLRLSQDADEAVKVPVRDLLQRAKELEVHDLSAFLESTLFTKHFALDANKTMIVKV